MILKRKKDSIKNKSDELLANYQITSKEYFDEILMACKKATNNYSKEDAERISKESYILFFGGSKSYFISSRMLCLQGN